jgi:cation diffusion facilitator family transporter
MTSNKGGTTRAIIALVLYYAVKFVLKFISFILTGSSSMLASGIHSFSEGCNQLLLLRGRKLSKKAPDAKHPFGYGRQRFVYAFLVCVIAFGVGGLFSLFEAFRKFTEVMAGEAKDVGGWKLWLSIAVLIGSMVAAGISTRHAVKEFGPMKGNKSWPRFVLTARYPEHPIVVLENIASLTTLCMAMFGLVMPAITGVKMFDVAGSTMIALTLCAVAIIMGRKTASLLVGESASRTAVARMEAALAATEGVVHVDSFKTLHIAPDQVMVNAAITVDSATTSDEVSSVIRRAEAAIKSVEPIVTQLYLQPAVASKN